MGYDDSFYNSYARYLKEPSVRRAHDAVLRITKLNPAFTNVVDLGCGQFNEFLHHRRPKRYLGIDLNVNEKETATRTLVSGDYRALDLVCELVEQQGNTAFVSLFSSEITAEHSVNYRFYEELFRRLPSVKYGLVSGFYYWNSKDKNPIGETGGIQSYQTLEPIENVMSEVFHETRISLPAPSIMFGPDVIEVWKLLERSTTPKS
jgi:hypothetical protein